MSSFVVSQLIIGVVLGLGLAGLDWVGWLVIRAVTCRQKQLLGVSTLEKMGKAGKRKQKAITFKVEHCLSGAPPRSNFCQFVQHFKSDGFSPLQTRSSHIYSVPEKLNFLLRRYMTFCFVLFGKSAKPRFTCFFRCASISCNGCECRGPIFCEILDQRVYKTEGH